MDAKFAMVCPAMNLFLSKPINRYIAFQTAVGLALHDTKPGAVPVIKESHFRQVVKISQSFKDYITSTHGNMDRKFICTDPHENGD